MEKELDTIEYNMDYENGFHRIALAKTKKGRNALLKEGYREFFTPDNDNINFWVLCRE